MKKILWIVFLGLFLSTSAHTDNIKDYKIENISIGDSALDYFNETELENGELDWFNYSYKEFATSLVSGKGIYDWFKISYKSDDDNFTIEGLVGIVVKKKYDDAECNKELDSAASNISGLFKNTKQSKTTRASAVIQATTVKKKAVDNEIPNERPFKPSIRLNA